MLYLLSNQGGIADPVRRETFMKLVKRSSGIICTEFKEINSYSVSFQIKFSFLRMYILRTFVY